MNGLGAATAEGPSEEVQGLSRKRVANAVRKVVSKVLPSEELGNAKEPPGRGVKSPEHPTRSKRGEKAASSPKPPPPPPPPPALPKPEAKKEAAKDELSLGLRSLMSRGRGKEHKARGKQSPGKGEKPSSQEPGSPDWVDSPEKAGSPAKPETPKKQRSPAPREELAALGSAGLKSDLTGEQQSKSPVPGVKQEVQEYVTNHSCPSPPSLKGQTPSQLAAPSHLNESRMTERLGLGSCADSRGCWLSLTQCGPHSCLGPGPAAGMETANQHAAGLAVGVRAWSPATRRQLEAPDPKRRIRVSADSSGGKDVFSSLGSGLAFPATHPLGPQQSPISDFPC